MSRFLTFLACFLLCQCANAEIPFETQFSIVDQLNWPIALDSLSFNQFDSNRPSPHRGGFYIFKVIPDLKCNSREKLVLYFPTEHLASVQVCMPKNGKLVPVDSVGNNHHTQFTEWGYPRIHTSDLEAPYYLVTSFNKAVYFPVKVMHEQEFMRFEVKGNFGLGMFYGLAAIIFLVNCLFLIFFRKMVFAYYGLFQAFIVTGVASSDGLLTFFSADPLLLNYADLPLHIGAFISGYFFARQFIGAPEAFAKIKVILILAVLLGVSAMFLYLQNGKIEYYLITECICMLMLLFYWIIALFHFKHEQNARIYVYAYSLYLFFAIEYYILRQFGLPGVALFSGQLKLSCITEMVILLIGMLLHASLVLNENRYFRQQIQEHLDEEMEKDTLGLRDLQEKYSLTDREAEVLNEMVQGRSNPEIAEKLFVSINTVKYHIRNIFLKMEINSRAEAISKVKYAPTK